jgi:hypothetical protein
VQIYIGGACLCSLRVVSFHVFTFINIVKFSFSMGIDVHFFKCNFYDTSRFRDLPYTDIYIHVCLYMVSVSTGCCQIKSFHCLCFELLV